MANREEECDTGFCMDQSLCDGCSDRRERVEFWRRTGKCLIFGSDAWKRCYPRKAQEMDAKAIGVYRDAGLGMFAGHAAYWEPNADGTVNIFPGGVPGTAAHDHIVINRDGGVEYMRINGEIINNYRDWSHRN